jgi:hypothetical protein
MFARYSFKGDLFLEYMKKTKNSNNKRANNQDNKWYIGLNGHFKLRNTNGQ